MKTWQAILLTVAIISSFFFFPDFVAVLVVVSTSAWVVYDSTKIGLTKYKSSIALKPAVLLIGMLFLWFIGFPWYLSVRYKIKKGLMPLKDK